MKLAPKITLLVTLILVITLGSMGYLSYHQMRVILTGQLEERLMDMAFSVAMDESVKTALARGTATETQLADLNARVEQWRAHSRMDFIVVMDMAGIRWTHPVTANIGKLFEGGDQGRVLTTGESYLSEVRGTLGVSRRAFVPILTGGRQIGAVSVGTTLVQTNRAMTEIFNQFIPFIAISLGLGIMAALVLTANIKQSILGLEPREIALLLKEKETILDNVKEGIITLDAGGELIQYNQEAARILKLTEQSPAGILASLKQSDLKDGDETGRDREIQLDDGLAILYKYSLLKNSKGKILGQIINFRDRTEVREMAEALTGYQRMAWSLRAQNHEFLNKLHTISGLIQLGETGEALQYISATAHGNVQLTDTIIRKIRNVPIAALLLSKYFQAEESRVVLSLDPDSDLDESTDGIRPDELETIIGNLLDNSLDAVPTDGTGRVDLLIRQEPQALEIRCANNGPRVPEELTDRVFDADFSTKPGLRGYGLYFIRQIADRAHGSVELVQDDQVTWIVRLPRKGDMS